MRVIIDFNGLIAVTTRYINRIEKVRDEASFTGSDLFYRHRSIKEPVEVELLRRAATAARRGMEAAVKSFRLGVTEFYVFAGADDYYHHGQMSSSNFAVYI
ncbi:hypothetical protein SDD30_10660 [Moorella naiadis]|uniref:hypothetical protein n=1 Tax=Moorella naiadis (nom. illeg.) TaxID=3093670 RepID=UPI003D9CAB64